MLQSQDRVPYSPPQRIRDLARNMETWLESSTAVDLLRLLDSGIASCAGSRKYKAEIKTAIFTTGSCAQTVAHQACCSIYKPYNLHQPMSECHHIGLNLDPEEDCRS